MIHYLPEKNQIQVAFNEVFRILRSGGNICFSVQQENFIHYSQNLINKFICKIRNKKERFLYTTFLKKDILAFMSNAGYQSIHIEDYTTLRTIYRNVPFFRKRGINPTLDSEHELNILGRLISNPLFRYFPHSFGSYWIVTAKKPDYK